MGDSLDFDVNNYTEGELLSLLGLNDLATKDDIQKKTHRFALQNQKRNKPNHVLFFQKVREKLFKYIDEGAQMRSKGMGFVDTTQTMYNADKSERKKGVAGGITYQSDSEYLYLADQQNAINRGKYVQIRADETGTTRPTMERRRLPITQSYPVELIQGQLNPIHTTTYEKSYVIDSQFRSWKDAKKNTEVDDASGSVLACKGSSVENKQVGLQESPSDFVVQFSSPLVNVLGYSISEYSILKGWYEFSDDLGTNMFKIAFSAGHSIFNDEEELDFDVTFTEPFYCPAGNTIFFSPGTNYDASGSISTELNNGSETTMKVTKGGFYDGQIVNIEAQTLLGVFQTDQGDVYIGKDTEITIDGKKSWVSSSNNEPINTQDTQHINNITTVGNAFALGDQEEFDIFQQTIEIKVAYFGNPITTMLLFEDNSPIHPYEGNIIELRNADNVIAKGIITDTSDPSSDRNNLPWIKINLITGEFPAVGGGGGKLYFYNYQDIELGEGGTLETEAHRVYETVVSSAAPKEAVTIHCTVSSSTTSVEKKIQTIKANTPDMTINAVSFKYQKSSGLYRAEIKIVSSGDNEGDFDDEADLFPLDNIIGKLDKTLKEVYAELEISKDSNRSITIKDAGSPPQLFKLIFYDETFMRQCSDGGGGAKLDFNFGTMLGFSLPIYDPSESFKSEGAATEISNDYIYLSIDDFNNNKHTSAVAAQSNIIEKPRLPEYGRACDRAPRTEAEIFSYNQILLAREQTSQNRYVSPTIPDVIAKIPTIQPVRNHFISTPGSAAITQSYRQFLGPVKIRRMRVRLFNKFGNLLNMGESGRWNFSIRVKFLYQY